MSSNPRDTALPGRASGVKLEKHVIPEPAAVYKPGDPYPATVLETEELTEAASPDEVRNLVLDIAGSGIRYLEGQSVGVVPPGRRPDGKPHKPRLYSVASARNGDDGLSKSVTICVKRVWTVDEETGESVPGLASHYLCDRVPGDTVPLIGPTGRRFLLPVDDTADLVMVAVGTGIAPFRAFIHYIFREKGTWRGRIRLYFGARQPMDALFMNRRNEDIGHYMTEQTFTAYRALSRVADDHAEKGYVQHRLAQNRRELLEILRRGHFVVYICGLKGMEEGIEAVFAELAAELGEEWPALKAAWVAEGRWLTEVY